MYLNCQNKLFFGKSMAKKNLFTYSLDIFTYLIFEHENVFHPKRWKNISKWMLKNISRLRKIEKKLLEGNG